jgi:hypothetical protein
MRTKTSKGALIWWKYRKIVLLVLENNVWVTKTLGPSGCTLIAWEEMIGRIGIIKVHKSMMFSKPETMTIPSDIEHNCSQILLTNKKA